MSWKNACVKKRSECSDVIYGTENNVLEKRLLQAYKIFNIVNHTVYKLQGFYEKNTSTRWISY